MITITRSLARRLWAVFRRMGLHKQPTAATRAVTLSTSEDELVVVAATNTAAVEYRQAGQYQPNEFVLPCEFLADCQGRTDDLVTLEHGSAGRATVTWLDKSIPQVHEFEPIDGDKVSRFPRLPLEMASCDLSLWSALAEGARSTDDGNVRYALGCLQLNGQQGTIAATNGCQMLIQSGFSFPWADSLLMPASKLLGFGELAPRGVVSIGHSDDWVTIGLGDWTVQLRIDKVGRFPNTDSVLPDGETATTRLQLSSADAEFLLASLPKLPNSDDTHRPVILDLNGQVKVRARGTDSSRATELLLTGSRCDGEAGTWKINRTLLARAVGMGFREIRLFGSTAPILCQDDRRKFVCALLDQEKSDSNHIDATVITSPGEDATAISATTTHTRRKSMAQTSSATASAQTERVKTANPSTRKASPSASPLEQLVTLRDSLREAAVQTNQVIRQLKQHRRQARLVETTLASLRQIQNAA